MSDRSEKKLISLILASNRPQKMASFLENINQTVLDASKVEVLVKIDVGDDVMKSILDEARVRYNFEIRYIQTPRLDGYYTLHVGYQQLFEIANSQSYFFTILSEEVRFKTYGWDRVLERYVGFFTDDVFRLKVSRLKYRNYYSHHDCGPTPENFPLLTRKWLELAGGVGDCWGPDGWHQYIDFHLGQTEGLDNIPGIFRSVPIHDIEIYGEEAGQDLKPEVQVIRAHRIFQEWWRMYRVEAQQGFRRKATNMFAYIWAVHEKLQHFTIVDVAHRGKVTVVNEHGKTVKTIYYHISPLYIWLSNLNFLFYLSNNRHFGFIDAFMDPSYGAKNGLRRFLNKLTRKLIVKSVRIVGRMNIFAKLNSVCNRRTYL